MFDLANKAVGDNGGVFEPASFIAFIVYLVAGLLVMAILGTQTGWYTNRRVTT
jgi:VIT1/CCC1 family predicted Fe2+/Mn2+ transporter